MERGGAGGPMASDKCIFFYEPGGREPPSVIRRFAERNGHALRVLGSEMEVRQLSQRMNPRCLVLAMSHADQETAFEACRMLKRDTFAAVIPVALLLPTADARMAAGALRAGADEVVVETETEGERDLRLDLLLRRADRDLSVHPTTRLPGTVQIERDLQRRLDSGRPFAACYADLDHFKEFNDRYGYQDGDRVIFILSRILKDLVRALAPGGFVGHIGGDDFLFTLWLEDMERVCDEVIALFDELIVYQYDREDQRAGYFLGEDRRGAVHRIPLMTLSIGVVTNQKVRFSHTAEVSERAAEMKGYAKTIPGSVFVVDRRGAAPPVIEGSLRSRQGHGLLSSS